MIRMRDWNDHGTFLKQGLAACSLTCRHWAVLLGPLLFEELTLRTGQDVSDLAAFIDADFLEPTLSGCVHRLIIIDDTASAEVPWSHQLMRLCKRLSSFIIKAWTVKGAPTVPVGQRVLPERRSPLPFLALPWTLSPSAQPQVSSLVLSGLSLSSVQSLVEFVGHRMPCSEVVVDRTTFAEALEEISPRLLHTCGLRSFYALDVFEDEVSVQRWIKISRMLFASKGHKQADETTLALVGKYLNLLLLRPRHQDEVQQLPMFPIEFNGRCIASPSMQRGITSPFQILPGGLYAATDSSPNIMPSSLRHYS